MAGTASRAALARDVGRRPAAAGITPSGPTSSHGRPVQTRVLPAGAAEVAAKQLAPQAAAWAWWLTPALAAVPLPALGWFGAGLVLLCALTWQLADVRRSSYWKVGLRQPCASQLLTLRIGEPPPGQAMHLALPDSGGSLQCAPGQPSCLRCSSGPGPCCALT